MLLGDLCYQAAEATLNSTKVQALIKSTEHFDLIITQEFFVDAIRGFQYHFKAPVIGINPIGSTFWVNEIMANPSIPSFMPEVMTRFSSRMTFFDRLVNKIVSIYGRLVYHFYIIPKHDKLMHKHFPNAPRLTDLLYNTSLILLNSHISTNQPIPLLPNMIEVGGFHMTPDKQLPNDIKEYLDDAKEGVIFFSLGSFFKSVTLPEKNKHDILNVFGKLKEKVLWKFEDDTLGALPQNVIVRKWFPQQDILGKIIRTNTLKDFYQN